jgi:hypothetical protein
VHPEKLDTLANLPHIQSFRDIELIPGIVCDGYVLDDDSAVMSERGTTDLLGMDQKTLKAMRGNWPPKTLKPFIDEGSTVRGNFVEVVAQNSPHCHREIVVYTTQTIKSLIHTYALAFINDGLRKNQIHIGKRTVALSISLVQTALDIAIKQACGLSPNIQQTAQKNYIDAVKLIKEFGFTCSAPIEIQWREVLAKVFESFDLRFNYPIGPYKVDFFVTKLMLVLECNGYCHRSF